VLVTAAYGLPDHLIDPVAYAVRVAWEAANSEGPNWDEEFKGRPVYTLKALWCVRVDQGVHADLLSAGEARELLRVVEDGIRVNAKWLQSPMAVCFESAFPAALDLDLKAEEVLMTLQDIANSESIAA
jgi:hypothetical protein